MREWECQKDVSGEWVPIGTVFAYMAEEAYRAALRGWGPGVYRVCRTKTPEEQDLLINIFGEDANQKSWWQNWKDNPPGDRIDPAWQEEGVHRKWRHDLEDSALLRGHNIVNWTYEAYVGGYMEAECQLCGRQAGVSFRTETSSAMYGSALSEDCSL